MSAFIPALVRTVLFLSFPLAPHGKGAKALPVVRLPTIKLLVPVDAVVGLALLVTTLADKHMAPVLPNCVLVMRSQRLESLVTDLTGLNHFSVMSFSYQHLHEFPHKPPLTSPGPGASR